MWVSFRGPPVAVEAPRGLPPHRSVHTFGLWLWGPDGSRHVGPRAATTPARRGRGVRFDSAAASLLPCRLRLSSDGASERASGGYKSSPPLAHSRRPTQTSPLPPHRRLIRHRSFVRALILSLSSTRCVRVGHLVLGSAARLQTAAAAAATSIGKKRALLIFGRRRWRIALAWRWRESIFRAVPARSVRDRGAFSGGAREVRAAATPRPDPTQTQPTNTPPRGPRRGGG